MGRRSRRIGTALPVFNCSRILRGSFSLGGTHPLLLDVLLLLLPLWRMMNAVLLTVFGQFVMLKQSRQC